jgi:hypothetical protein
MGQTEARHPVGFVVRMDLKRLELGMGHAAWARYLNISENLWYRLRRGDRQLTPGTAERVLREWRSEFEPLLADAFLARAALRAC